MYLPVIRVFVHTVLFSLRRIRTKPLYRGFIVRMRRRLSIIRPQTQPGRARNRSEPIKANQSQHTKNHMPKITNPISGYLAQVKAIYATIQSLKILPWNKTIYFVFK